jgi:zinc D-Ala-D-Ala carboxypeptidase
MQLSKNFALVELITSQEAARRGLDNTPTPQVITNLTNLVKNVLQPLRDLVGKPIVISSGYRSPAVNSAIGGAINSEHMTGCAADFTIPGKTNKETAQLIMYNLTFNQLILEFYREDNPYYGWVHCSYSASGNKKEVLHFDGNNYYPGL